MGTITKYIDVHTDAPEVWDAIRDFGAPHERLVPGFVVAAETEGAHRRITFASGAAATERPVAVDDDHRRLVYAVVESQIPFTHHQSSVEVVVLPGSTGCRIAWTTDFLPDDLDGMVDGLMTAGAAAMDGNFNR
jgi:Polyketide cyclase / dehydrase and lipid transport